jgi:hypothetical protein
MNTSDSSDAVSAEKEIFSKARRKRKTGKENNSNNEDDRNDIGR